MPRSSVHAVKPDGAVSRMRLPLQKRVRLRPAAPRRSALALIENGKGSATLEAMFKTAQGTMVVRASSAIKRGDVSPCRSEPGAGAAKLRVECPGRFVVLAGLLRG